MYGVQGRVCVVLFFIYICITLYSVVNNTEIRVLLVGGGMTVGRHIFFNKSER